MHTGAPESQNGRRMQPERVPHFEIKLGLGLIVLDCLRIILPWHGYGAAVRVLFDGLAILGGILYLFGFRALRGAD